MNVKKLSVFLAMLMFVLVLGGCSSDGEVSDGAVESSGVDGQTDINFYVDVAFPDDETKSDYGLMVNYAVDGWTYPAESSAASWSPGDGKKLILLNLTVMPTDADVVVGGRDFGVWYGDWSFANWYADATSIPAEFPEDVTVNAGEEFTGDVLFEVDETAVLEDFIFDVYQSDVGKGEEMELTLGDMM